MTEHERQAERRDQILRDREQQKASTLLDHAQSQANEINQGRFGALGNPHVVGAASVPKYPAASSPWQGPDPVPNEEPLGYSVDSLNPEPSTGLCASPLVEETGSASADAPSPSTPSRADDEQRADAGPPSLDDSAPLGVLPARAQRLGAESSPLAARRKSTVASVGLPSDVRAGRPPNKE